MSRFIDADLLKAGFEEDGHLSPYIEGFIDACPTVETGQKWISVKERLPKSQSPVLALCKTNQSPVIRRVTVLTHINAHEVNTESDSDWYEYEGETEYDEENDCFWIPECWYETNIVDDNPNWTLNNWWSVTHWMPLPEPQKEEEYV